MGQKDKKKEKKKPVTKYTESGIPLKRLYTPDDLKDFDYERDLGGPGEYPFTRGIHPSMYTERLWTVRQYAGFGSSEDANKRYKFLIDQGQSGLNVAMDLPTQLGYDSDSSHAQGEVGRVGVAIDTLDDMENIFNGIPLGKISAAFTINAPASIILAMYTVVAEKQGVPRDQIRGTVQNDILKEYIARGTFIFPPTESIRLACDIIEYCQNESPRFNAISISGHMNCAGAYSVQTAAYMCLNALVYLDELVKRGISAEKIASVLAFMTTMKANFFENIATVRALRRKWAKMMKEDYGIDNKRAQTLRIMLPADTGNLIIKQPLNNITRTTLRALSSVLAGAQAIAIPCYDEAFAIPNEESSRISLMIHQIIAHETGIPDVADPLGGSYYVETLTNQCEEKMNEIIDDVRSRGGMLKLIEKGEIQRQMTSQLYQYQKSIQEGKTIVMGLNKYAIKDEDISKYEGELHEYDNTIMDRQIEKLKKVKAGRDNEKTEKALKELEDAFRGSENMMHYMIEAVKSYASIGEIVGTLEKITGGRFRAPTGV